MAFNLYKDISVVSENENLKYRVNETVYEYKYEDFCLFIILIMKIMEKKLKAMKKMQITQIVYYETYSMMIDNIADYLKQHSDEKVIMISSGTDNEEKQDIRARAENIKNIIVDKGVE